MIGTQSPLFSLQATVALFLLHRWAGSTAERRNGAEAARDRMRVAARLTSAAIVFILYGVGMSSLLIYGEQQFRLPLKVSSFEGALVRTLRNAVGNA